MMPEEKHAKRRLQFTLRSCLVLLVLIACALGFWQQERRLSKARSILAAHGLELEWRDLNPGELRATVLSMVENDSYVLLKVRVQSQQSGSVAILDKGKLGVRSVLDPVRDSNTWTGEVDILVDNVRQSNKDAIVKAVVSVGGARTESIQTRSDNPKLSEIVHLYLLESTVFRLGERLPLCEVGDQEFELIVQ